MSEPSALRVHDVTLAGERVVLRPMTERDWPLIEAINNNPEVGYFSEEDEWTPYTLQKLQRIYRSISQNALMFVIEHESEPVGECWLQRMNAPRILDELPGRDVRRIDIAIGAPRLWGKGLGSEAIRLLVRLAFEREGADLLVCFCSGHNPRSRRAFEKAGLAVWRTVPRPGSPKSSFGYDLILTREEYERTRSAHLPPPDGAADRLEVRFLPPRHARSPAGRLRRYATRQVVDYGAEKRDAWEDEVSAQRNEAGPS